MSSPEGVPNKRSHSLEIIALAKELKEKRIKEGHPQVALPVAIALQIQKIGIEKLKKHRPLRDSNLLTREKLEEYFNRIKGIEEKKEFLSGLGEVLIGSVISSLELGVSNGWEEKYFPENFNLAIVGTVIRKLDPEFVKQTAGAGRTPKEETNIITQELIKDKTFLSFFNDGNVSKLPRSIYEFFKKDNFFRDALEIGFLEYQEVIQSVNKP